MMLGPFTTSNFFEVEKSYSQSLEFSFCFGFHTGSSSVTTFISCNVNRASDLMKVIFGNFLDIRCGKILNFLRNFCHLKFN
jgi:hypothetical protein